MAEQTKWGNIPLKFAWNILIGAIMFVVIGSVAVGLREFVYWMESRHLPRWMVSAATWIEYGLYGVDIALFALYVGRSAYHHAREMLALRVE